MSGPMDELWDAIDRIDDVHECDGSYFTRSAGWDMAVGVGWSVLTCDLCVPMVRHAACQILNCTEDDIETTYRVSS